MTYSDPVWRDLSNFVIRADIESDTDVVFEQLFAQRVTATTFRVCCIPFFPYDMALGDIVETDRGYRVLGTTGRSGRYAFRVRLSGSTEQRQALEINLVGLGALYERYSPDYWAIDADGPESAQTLADLLAAEQEAGSLLYETSR